MVAVKNKNIKSQWHEEKKFRLTSKICTADFWLVIIYKYIILLQHFNSSTFIKDVTGGVNMMLNMGP